MEYLITYEPEEGKIRLGNENDGGYIIIDNYEYDSYISCGISDNYTFDEDFVKYRPGIIYNAFDGTINQPKDFPKEINFNKLMIDNKESETSTNLKEYLTNNKDIFLKMDIEGSEWNWLKDTEIKNVKQLVIEFHGLFDDRWGATVQAKTDVFKKLSETHWLVHVHGNNYRENNEVPYVLECTYIRKSDCRIKGKNKNPYPISIDSPNNAHRPDHILNKWPFVDIDN